LAGNPIAKDGSFRSSVFLDFVRSLPCAVFSCRVFGVDPHHFPGKGASGATRDDMTAPLCRLHHDMAQKYIFTREEQARWVAETRSLFLQRASTAQMATFFTDWMTWREGRVFEEIPA